jgi:hypothetical protein
MKHSEWLLVAVLAGAVAYAIKSEATRALDLQVTVDGLPIAVLEAAGIVTMSTEDFYTIVRIHNRQRGEIHYLKSRKGCP